MMTPLIWDRDKSFIASLSEVLTC